MERKMLFQKIRENNLQQKCHQMFGTDYTHLSNAQLLKVLETVKTTKSTKKATAYKATCAIDNGARKAIKAIAAVLGMRDIEKNF